MDAADVEEARFRAEVAASPTACRAFVKWVTARYPGRFSYEITVPKMRPAIGQRVGYGDSYDVALTRIADGRRFEVEVKWRKLGFSSEDDYPYPTIFVDRSAKIARHTPAAYVIVSRNLDAIAVIDQSSRANWRLKIRVPAQAAAQIDVYECPKELARFYRL